MKNRNLLYLFVLIFIIACSKDDDHFSGSLGNLEIAQYDFIAGTSHRLPVYLKTTPEVMLDDQSVEVFLENAVGNEIDRIGSLYDNGDVTYYNDDIAGDLVFSGFITLNVAEEGAYSIVAKAQTTSGQRIESSPVEIHVYQKAGFEGREMVEDVFEASEDILQSYISSGRSMEASIQLTIDDLKMNENISEVTRIPNSNYLEVLMANNRKSVIAIYDADNPIKGGKSSDRGTPKRRLGKVEEANVNILRDINPFAPGNRNVLIYSPHESFFQDGAAVKNVFEEADCGEFKIDYVTGTNAGIDILNNLSDYGTIYISAHGVGGAILSTGEQIQSTHWGDNKFQALWGAEKLVPSNELTVDGQEVVSGDHVWLITYKWFDQNLSNLPNSMVFLNACQSTMTSRLSDAFLSAGASCVFGYSESVHVHFGKEWGIQWAKEMAQDGFDSGDVGILGKEDLLNGGKVELKGSSDISYSLEFNNGDFEHELREWTTYGDGRAVVALGDQNATQGQVMGLISTGLGKTTSSGTMMQSFIVSEETQLSVTFNLLSEEFLEYIGSTYQDKFTISIVDRYGQEEILYHRTIDQVASEFGANQDDPGQLKSTSTDLGENGVYMTGWQTINFSISQFRNKCITLKFYCQDVGDSAYDTAVLLDDIEIK